MIITCKCCMGTGEIRAFNPWLQMIKEKCPRCGGAGKWREGEEFTTLEHIALPILRDMARVAPWMVMDETNGRIMFHEGPGVPEGNGKLLNLLTLTGRIATYMEQHNWLVTL